MSYFTETKLREFASSHVLNESAGRVLQKSFDTKKVSIFLSHSHKDQELAKGLKNHLASFGIGLYIDWQDTDMPEKTSRETANKIKNRIFACKLLLVLATANAMTSRWVPWEIGVADTKGTPDNIIIVPVADRNGDFHGNEYLQLYKRIIIANSGLTAIFDPNKTEGYLIENWLSGITL